MAKILMIVGSMRKRSFNRQMAGEIEKMIGERAEVKYLEYADLPYMNQDIEFPTPEVVARVRGEVQAADGIWICTPEYNFNIPGVLKNLLDWLSRPLVENDWNSGSAAGGKTVTISGAGGKNATKNVRASLAGLLEFMQMKVICGEWNGIALDGSAFATDEANFSEENLAALKAQVDAFLEELGK